MAVTIYTDGSCHDETRTGGWAYYVDNWTKGSGSCFGRVTSQNCELIAVICALNRMYKEGIKDVILKIDSQWVVRILNDCGGNKTHPNKIVRRAINKIAKMDKVIVKWIPEGSESENEHCHRMAYARMKEARVKMKGVILVE